MFFITFTNFQKKKTMQEALINLSMQFSSTPCVWLYRSFGVFLWELLTNGYTPYPGTSAEELPHQLERGLKLTRPHMSSDKVWALLGEALVIFSWHVHQFARNREQVSWTNEKSVLCDRQGTFLEKNRSVQLDLCQSKSLGSCHKVECSAELLPPVTFV